MRNPLFVSIVCAAFVKDIYFNKTEGFVVTVTFERSNQIMCQLIETKHHHNSSLQVRHLSQSSSDLDVVPATKQSFFKNRNELFYLLSLEWLV